MGKNNRQKQGSFFQSLFQVHSFNIRDFRASSADEEAFSLLFECQEQFRATLRRGSKVPSKHKVNIRRQS